MRTFIFLLLIISTSLSVTAQDLAEFKKNVYTSSAGHALPYRILYPKNYDQTKKYPLVLVLHGAGERGDDNEKQLVHGSKLFLDSLNRLNYPAIVIFPQCASESYWANVDVDRTKNPYTLVFDYTRPIMPPLQAAIELVQKTIAEGSVDSKRVYITGLSMGGMGTFEAVYRFPKLFAAAAPICGGADLKAYDKRVAKTPFYIFHGADDAVVGVENSREAVAKLKSLKTKHVTYMEYPGVNHNSWDNAFAEPDYLSWMFSKRKK